jgi:hypothetical protein
VILWPKIGIPGNLTINICIEDDLINKVRSIVSQIETDTLVQAKNGSFLHGVTAKNLLKDFYRCTTEYLSPLIMLDKLHTRSPIDLGIWGNPCIHNSGTLIKEYLLKRNIPLIGMQHGSTPGIQSYDVCFHFDSQYSRCTHFLTYGFDEQDLKSVCPDKQIACKIIPVGTCKEHTKNFSRKRKKQKIDILFPLTNSLSITIDGIRIKPDVLTRYQLEILQTLEAFKDLYIVAKPMLNYSDKNCSVVEALKRLKHIKVISDLSLQSYLEKYDIRAVIIEYPSTPLFEVMGRDIEIFLLADPVSPFSQQVLNLLKKRVHYFENIEDLKKSLGEWRQGNLPSLRNNEFYNKYVFRENTEDLILRTIKRCVSHRH